MTKIDSYSSYQELSREVGSDNDTQAALKEAWQILEGVKKSGNSELLDKFTKEYIEIYSRIQDAKNSHNEVSISERQQILLELSDMINLAQVYQINEYKGKTKIANSLGNFFKGINPKEIKSKSLDLRDKNIDEYGLQDALGALEYLNNNYKGYDDLSKNNQESITEIINSSFGYEHGTYNLNVGNYISNYGAVNLSNNYDKDSIFTTNSDAVKSCDENDSSLFNLESNLRKALTFNYHTINELDDKYEVRLFQELAVKKILGKERNAELNENGFSNKYLHGFNNEKGNFVMEIQEMEDLLFFENSVTDINSKALANYVFYLKQKNSLDPSYLVENIHPSNLMELGKLWSKDDNTDESKNRLIAKDTILKTEGGKDFINLVTTFKDIDSIKKNFMEIINDENPNEKMAKLPECYKLFLSRSSDELTKVIIDSVEDSIKSAKERNPGRNIDQIVNVFRNDLKKEIGNNSINIEKIFALIKDFSLQTGVKIDGIPLIDKALEVSKTENTFESLTLNQSKADVLRNKKLIEAESKYANTTEDQVRIKQEQERLNLEYEKINFQILSNSVNNADLELFSTLTAEEKLEISTGKTTTADLIAKKIEEGNKEVIDIVSRQRNVIEGINEKFPKFASESKILDNAFANKAQVRQVYATYYPENTSTTSTAKTNNSAKSNNINNNSSNNFQSSLNYSGYYPETKINISRGMGGEYYVQSKNEDKKFPITQQESELLSSQKDYRENFSNFLETVNELGLEEFWDYREDLFKTIDNLIGGTAFKKDSEKLNDLDMIRFLSTIVKSYGVEPKNRTLGELKLQVKELNFGSVLENDVVRNSRGESNIFSNFKEKFIDEGIFRQLDFEKFLLNPNSNNKTGIEQQIS